MDSCFIANQQIEAHFRSKGAELCRLRIIHGPDLLWGGDPEIWGRHAPVLFPIVGQLPNGEYTHQDKTYKMERHGFARDMDWRLVRLTRESCVWSLEASEATLAQFPFPFEIRLHATLDGTSLKMAYEIRNTGTESMPAGFGAHPGFCWPLFPGLERNQHLLEFASEESAPVRRLTDGQLDPHPFPNPIDGRKLTLRDELFTEDALIFDDLKSKSVRYRGPEGPTLEMKWEGFKYLGLWTIPGAPFLCIEPWAALPAYSEHQRLLDNPSIFPLEAQSRRLFSWSIGLAR